MRCSAHQRPRSAHSAGSRQPPNSSRTRARVFLTRDRRVIGLRREVVTAAEEDRTGGAGRGAAARDPHFANAAGASGPRGRAVGSGRRRMGAGPRGALRTPASAGFRHARPSTVSRLPVCTSVLPRHARAGHAALAACRGHAGRRWRARRARLSPGVCVFPLAFKDGDWTCEGLCGVCVPLRAGTNTRACAHTRTNASMRTLSSHLPGTCRGCWPRCPPLCPAPLIAPQECAGCRGWGSRADTVTGSRGAAALGHQLSARDV